MKSRTPHKKAQQMTVYLVVPILLVLTALMIKDWVNKSPLSEIDHSRTDQEPTDFVENISTTKLAKFLNECDIDSALPILEDLRNKILIKKESDHQDEDIVYSMGSGFIQAYSATRDKGYLQKAKEGFDHYIQMYPQGKHAHHALINKVTCHRGLAEFAEAIKALQILLHPNRPYFHLLSDRQKEEALWHIVQAMSFEKEWERGIPWFTKLLQSTKNSGRKMVGATALVEAYLAKKEFNQLDSLMPYFTNMHPERLNVRTNFQFLQAGSILSEAGQHEQASRFYSLVLTPKEILNISEELLEDYQSEIEKLTILQDRLGADFSEDHKKRLDTLQFEKEKLIHRTKRVENLVEASADYIKDLLEGKAQNYKAMGRSWETFWCFVDLAMYTEEIIENISPEPIPLSIARPKNTSLDKVQQYLNHQKNRFFAYEVGLRLINILQDQASKSEVDAANTKNLTKRVELRKQCNSTYEEMWETGILLLQSKPEDKLAPNLAYLIGNCWIKRGKQDKEHWEKLADTFEKLATKEFEKPKPFAKESFHYWAGLARFHLQEFKLARRHFQTVVTDYPNGEYHKDAQMYIESINE